MTTTPILPPFPFPDQWATINILQRSTGEKKWLVPNYTSTAACCGSSDTQEHSNTHGRADVVSTISKDYGYELGTEGEGEGEFFEDEQFELNPEWAARFSKTIKRIKQKAHKAKRRAGWKKK